MSTLIVLNINKPDGSTDLPDVKVTLRDKNGAIHGINYTNATGQVSFNLPTMSSVNVLDKTVDLHKAMWCTIDGVGEIPNFDVPASGTLTGTIVFDTSADQMAITHTFVAS